MYGPYSLPQGGTELRGWQGLPVADNIVPPEDRYRKNFRTGVTYVDGEVFSGTREPPAPRCIYAGGWGGCSFMQGPVLSGPRRTTLEPGYKPTVAQALCAPRRALSFFFPARMSLLQETDLIVPLTSSSSQDHIDKDRGLFVMEETDGGMSILELFLRKMTLAASPQLRTCILLSLLLPSPRQAPFRSVFPLFIWQKNSPGRSEHVCSAA